jgi:hypothetical protein
MNFIEAIKKLQEGYNLTRKLGWLDEHCSPEFIYYDNIDCEYKDEKKNKSSFYNDDFLADDWELTGGDKFIKYVGYSYTFEQALTAYKSGKSIRRKSSMIHNEISNVYMDICNLDRDDIMANDWEILP